MSLGRALPLIAFGELHAINQEEQGASESGPCAEEGNEATGAGERGWQFGNDPFPNCQCHLTLQAASKAPCPLAAGWSLVAKSTAQHLVPWNDYRKEMD